jgi:spermidine dehydrogenase
MLCRGVVSQLCGDACRRRCCSSIDSPRGGVEAIGSAIARSAAYDVREEGSSPVTDRDLGMHRRITRRDFLNGVALAVGGTAFLPNWGAALLGADAGTSLAAVQTTGRSVYPPALTGLRGSHAGSFEAFHALKDGTFWDTAGSIVSTRETYDLAVVGGGISGLAAAYYYRKAVGKRARIIVLDNHDDFGGHAKRNEFTANGRMYLGFGGTQSIDSPAPYSPVAKALIAELGIDVLRRAQVLDANLYTGLGLRRAFFFDKETFGVDRLVGGYSHQLPDAFLDAAPLSAAVKHDVRRLFADQWDPMPELSSADRKVQLARMSYTHFLTHVWHLDPGVLPLFQTRTHGLFGVGIDAVPAQDAWGLGLPGFQGMHLDPGAGPGQNRDAIRHPEAEDYFFHFPDGNASVARLLVRRLIPGAIPGSTMDDVVTAQANYAWLDMKGSPVRIRLNSTVVRVRHDGPAASARGVEVVYVRGGRLHRVWARAVVLACWHSVIPYLCPDLPVRQQAALEYAVKVPLVYTNVFIRQWTAFQHLGVHASVSPGLWHTSVRLDAPVSLGSYRFSRSPAEPIVLHLSKTPCKPGLEARAQHRAGRMELLSTSFETIERHIREQLARMVGDGGFDPADDILAITVNRWPHGYAYQYNSLSDPFWLEGGEPPCVIARQRVGRIAIANTDAAAYAYTDAAIDQAHRAVHEILDLR